MPNRILREGILTSPRIAKLGWADETFYRRLMSVVDDFGRYYADHGLLRAACYPRQLNKVSDSDIGKWLRACVDAALVRVYPAQDGESYLQLLDFRQQTRAKTSKYPAMDSVCVADAEHAHTDGEADAPVFVFGDVVGDVSPQPPTGGSRFDEFWALWPSHPRKAAESQCRDKWETKGCEPIADRVISGLKAHIASEIWAKDGGQFIPAPMTWLNQCRWEAAVVPARSTQAATSTAAVLSAMDERAATATKPPLEQLNRAKQSIRSEAA